MHYYSSYMRNSSSRALGFRLDLLRPLEQLRKRGSTVSYRQDPRVPHTVMPGGSVCVWRELVLAAAWSS